MYVAYVYISTSIIILIKCSINIVSFPFSLLSWHVHRYFYLAYVAKKYETDFFKTFYIKTAPIIIWSKYLNTLKAAYNEAERDINN